MCADEVLRIGGLWQWGLAEGWEVRLFLEPENAERRCAEAGDPDARKGNVAERKHRHHPDNHNES